MTDPWTITSAIGTAVGAIGTIAAAAIPGLLFLAERKERKSAQAELRDQIDRQAAEARIRAQTEATVEARRVSVWNQEHEIPSWTARVGTTNHLHIVNNSNDPIFDLRAYISAVESQSGQMLPNCQVGESKSVLAPTERMEAKVGANIKLPGWIEFTDVRQRRWKRTTDGDVEQIH